MAEEKQPAKSAIRIAALLKAVVDNNASDLHINAGSAPRIRVHGKLRPLDVSPLSKDEVKNLVYEILTDKQKARFEKSLALDYSYAIPNFARFRVNIYQQKGSVGAAFRLIPQVIHTVEDLGLPAVINRFAEMPRGLVLITGTTGSGKTTTLAALIDKINRTRAEHIITIEDPIEFIHSHKACMVSQRAVGDDTESFAAALRDCFRQDPDVILVGEMRDLDTIGTAITAAETGHLVFATLHTQDAVQSVDRIIDVFPANQQAQIRVQLADTLQGIVSQMLLPTRDGAGRIPAVEVMLPTVAIRSMIREGKTHQIANDIQTGAKLGMQSMDYALAQLAREGKVDPDLAEAKAKHKDEYRRFLEGVVARFS
jgi:twitching motility protein PilT